MFEEFFSEVSVRRMPDMSDILELACKGEFDVLRCIIPHCS